MALPVTQAIANNYPTTSVDFGSFPKGGQKVVTATVNFSALVTSVNIDLSLAHTENKLEYVQAIYCDNSQNSGPVSIVVPVTNQVVSWPAFSQGWLPVAATNAFAFLANCTSAYTGNLVFQFANCPYPADVWSVGAIPVQNTVVDPNGKTISLPGATSLLTTRTQSSGAVAQQFLNTNYGYFTGFFASISGDAYLAAAGEYNVTFNMGGVSLVYTIYLPGAQPAAPIPSYQICDVTGLTYFSTSNSGYAQIVTSSALAGGWLTAGINFGQSSTGP